MGLVGCVDARSEVYEVVSGGGALNEPFSVRLKAPVHPATAAPPAIRVTGPDGAPLAFMARCRDDRLELSLVIDAQVWADPPARAVVRLSGAPAAQVVEWRSGGVLASSIVLDWELAPRLVDPEPGLPRLVELRGRRVLALDAALAGGADAGPGGVPVVRVPVDGVLTLVFDGVLDPETLGTGSVLVHPVAGEVLLDPWQPEITWRVVGRAFEITLALPEGAQDLQLSMRRVRWRDLSGRPVDGALSLLLDR